jgi:phosphohistidine phosphatase
MASKQLVLIRHGKAADGAVDAERPLADRGRRDAVAVGRWLAQQGIRPDRVVVSSALRAQQTWAAARAELDACPDPIVDGRVFDNDEEILVEIVREAPDEVATLVLIGHNPSFERFAHDLDDGTGDEAAHRALAAGYPTCGIAVFGVNAPWPDIRHASLLAFAAPRG